MAENGVRSYKIVINGLTESITQVEKLTKALETLEERINAIDKSSVKIASNSTSSTSTGGGSKSSSNSSLSEEEKLQRQIAQLEEKRVAYQSELYQGYLANKELLKETVNDQKQLAAQERLQANAYSNTIQGMKQELADIKQAMQTVDLGDGEQFKQMTDRANELNSKLLEIEKSYGQFGRNVGNYPDATQGLNNIVIAVNGVEREFSNAREASRELSNELKSMALNGQQDTKEFKELQKTVLSLNSTIKDATVSSKAMDDLLDTMQSLTALGSTAKGLSAIFGFDSSAIDESIQKLVALQNVMQSLEKIQQQLKTGEFMGGWLSKGNQAVDNLAASLTGANKAQVQLNNSTTAGATASKSLAVAETAQAAATNTATVATKALSLALKTIGIGLIISAVAMLITYWKDIYNWFTDTIPALKSLESWFGKIRAVAVGVGTAIANYLIQPFATLGKAIAALISGNFKEIPNIIADGFKKTYNVIGNYQKGYNKEIERQQEAHNEKMRQQQKKANEEAEKDAEAKYGTDLNRTKEYYKKQLALTKKGSDEYKDLQRKLWETERQQKEQNNKKKLTAAKNAAKEESDVEKILTQLRISNMKEGLNKTLKQLEEERKAKLAKIIADGKLVEERSLEINRYYDNKVEEEKRKHSEEIRKIYDEMWANILSKQIESQEKMLANERANQENQNSKAEDKLREETAFEHTSSYGIQSKNSYSPSTQQSLGIISTSKDSLTNDMKQLLDLEQQVNIIDNRLAALRINTNNTINDAEQKWINSTKKHTEDFKKLEDEKSSITNEQYLFRKKIIDEEYSNAALYYLNVKEEAANDVNILENQFNDVMAIYTSYQQKMNELYSAEEQEGTKWLLREESYTKSLGDSFTQRVTLIDKYWAERFKVTKENAEKVYSQELEIAKNKKLQEETSETEWYNKQLEISDKYVEKQTEKIEAQAAEEKWTIKKKKAAIEAIEADAEATRQAAKKAHEDKLKAIQQSYATQEETLLREKDEKLKTINNEYYQDTLQEFRDFQTAINNLESKQPIRNVWGFTNQKETQKNNRELLAAYEKLVEEVRIKRIALNDAFENGFVDRSVYESSLREMDSFVAGIGEKMDKVKQEMSLGNQIGTFIQEAQMYVQTGLQAVQTIMQAFQTMQDAAFDRQQEALDKENEMLEKKLDEQDEIIQQHKDNVDSIEDELANSRGERRQHLIDQLNAEMEKQREAQKEEQRLQKKKEANERKQEALDKQRKKAEYKRNLLQILVSTAMAAANGYATQPFVPVGLAMGSLALALGAVQYAAAEKAKPYAKGGQLDGGVAVGPRHRDGGIKVLGGRSEIEGGEFITNRISTQYNAPLLEFINSKKKRVDVNDMIDFYSSGRIKKNITSLKAKYADGGYVPTLPNNIDIREQLQNVVVNQDNRPIYVTVTDIENKMEDVRYVRTLAGLNE